MAARPARIQVSDDAPRDPARRTFLKGAAIAAGGFGLAGALPAAPAQAVPSTEELAREHADDAGLLIDLTKCTGCGSCVTACKLEYGLEWRADQPTFGPETTLASESWTVVRTAGETAGGDPRYVKTQCMHCLEPACASACPVRALRKEAIGAVTYDVNRCIGCRYCLVACPFSVPTFEWDETFGRVSKCDLCVSRTSHGDACACAEACPTGAVTYGRRGELLAEAHRRIEAEPDRYVHHVYGQTEAGGTSVLYLSDVPFSELGFVHGLPEGPLPDYTWPLSRLVPPAAAGLGALLVVLYARRRRAIAEASGQEEAEP